MNNTNPSKESMEPNVISPTFIISINIPPIIRLAHFNYFLFLLTSFLALPNIISTTIKIINTFPQSILSLQCHSSLKLITMREHRQKPYTHLFQLKFYYCLSCKYYSSKSSSINLYPSIFLA